MAGEQDIGLIAPADTAFDIVLDTVFPTTRGVYVGGQGNLRVRMAGGQELTFVGLQAGMVHPLQIVLVFNGGTGATGIIGLR